MVEKGLCFSCFGKHLRKDCKATVNCQVGGCKGHHHTLLHEINSRENRFREATPSNQVQDASSIQTSTAATAATVTPTTTGILATQTLATETEPQRSSSTEHMPYSARAQIAPCQVVHQIIPVYLYGPNGQRLKTLCLLDTGSNATLVLQALAEKVGFTGELGEISLGGTNTSEVVRSFPVDSLGISGVGRRHRRYTTHSALTVPALNNPEYVVVWPAEKEKYPHLQNLPLQCTDASKIGIILGLPDFRLKMPLECREGPRGSPTAIRTKLGWVAFSHVPAHSRTIQVCRISVDSGVDAGVEDSLSISQHFEKWFNDEAIPVPKRKNEIRSIEDEKAYKLLKKNTKRIPGMNAFESGILWRDSAPVIPNNRKVAEAHLRALEKRLEREPALKSAYDASIVTDVTNGYIRKMSKEEVASVESSSSTMVHYLLHHPVRNPKKPGKVRRVYNAAAKCQGKCLNDFILRGPDLLGSLFGILVRFREGLITLCADAKDMYLMLRLRQEDKPALRFLYRSDNSEVPDVYQCERRIFGECSAPACANYTVLVNAEEHREEFPRAAASLENNRYMDDTIESVESKEEAACLCKDLSEVMKRGGFHLTKWASNSPEVLAENPKFDRAEVKEIGPQGSQLFEPLVLSTNHQQTRLG